MSAELTRHVTAPPLPPSPAPAEVEGTGLVVTSPSDTRAIDEIVGRLERRYARDQISVADLQGRVRGFYSHYATASIRTFIAILVERLVRRSVEAPSPSPLALY